MHQFDRSNYVAGCRQRITTRLIVQDVKLVLLACQLKIIRVVLQPQHPN